MMTFRETNETKRDQKRPKTDGFAPEDACPKRIQRNSLQEMILRLKLKIQDEIRSGILSKYILASNCSVAYPTMYLYSIHFG
jgi:hypothetical protein